MTERVFTLSLMVALSGRTRGRTWGDDYRHCVLELFPSLWLAATQFSQDTEEEPLDLAKDEARLQSANAHEIGRMIDRLLRLLSKHERAVSKASIRGYLPSSVPRDRPPTTLRDLNTFEWSAAKSVSQALSRARVDVKRWEDLARLNARRRPGPKVGDRITLVEFIGLQLKRHSIPLTRSKAGYFGRVVDVVYRAAGIASKNLYRDIQAAFENQPLLIARQPSRYRISPQKTS